jgi:hypothetical protein
VRRCRLSERRPAFASRRRQTGHPLVAIFELERTQVETFSALASFRPTQSNYSLSLALAAELDFWHPDNTSEDLHTCLKAVAHTNNARALVVTVWSLVLNDAVEGLSDRWTQAKRHMWGVEEVAWVLALYPRLRLRVWLQLLLLSAGQLLAGTIVPLWTLVIFPQTHALWRSLLPPTRTLLVGLWLGGHTYRWLRALVRESLLQSLVLAHRSEQMLPMGARQWALLALSYPLAYPLGAFVFSFCATYRVLWHALWHHQLRYVTAPKTASPCVPRRVQTASFANGGRHGAFENGGHHGADAVPLLTCFTPA